MAHGDYIEPRKTMKKTFAFAVLAAAFGLSGCAATEPNAGSTAAGGANDEVMTGSRIPRKASAEPQKGMSKEDWRLESGRGIGNATRGN
jgi:hypothetical protein